jgi:predicted O-methyltransferase YrrM
MFNTKTLTEHDIISGVGDKSNINNIISVINKLSRDPVFTDQLMDMLQHGQLETRCFVYYFAKQMQPDNYLEIGTRRGWSMAAVIRACAKTKIYGFDMWKKGYAGSINPGAEFVRTEMLKIGNNNITFINGNSHDTIPAFFKQNPNMLFDLILVDGDHSKIGAMQDISDIIGYIRIGGVIIFDDLITANLNDVWQQSKMKYTNFRFFSYLKQPPGVGVAIRVQ